MARRSHLITVRPLPSLPARVLSLATEPNLAQIGDYPGRQYHTLGAWAIVRTDYRRGEPFRVTEHTGQTSGECWRCIDSLLRGQGATWLIAHNLAYHLALVRFWDWLEMGWGELLHFCIDDPPTTVRLRVGRCLLCCADLLNYWRKPLETVQSSLCHDQRNFRCSPPAPGGGPQGAAVSARIVSGAILRLVSFLSENLGGGFAGTAAGIAWAAYRSRVWGDRVRVHSCQKALDLERAALVAPPVLCHRLGEINDDVTILDANNLYGVCMHANRFPIRLRGEIGTQRNSILRILRDGRGVVCSVRTRVSGEGFRCDPNDGSRAATESNVDTLCGRELAEGIESGLVLSIGEAYAYEMGAPFSAYVEHWYAARRGAQEEGNRAGAALAKLLTSTLYGRLMMRGRKWEPYRGPPPPYRYHVWQEPVQGDAGYRQCRCVAGKAEQRADGGEWYHSCPAVSAYILMYARRQMAEWVRIAGQDQVLYQDTDCLHVLPAGLSRLVAAGQVHQTRLGALKIVHTHPWIVYDGPTKFRTPAAPGDYSRPPSVREVAEGTWLQDRKLGLRRLAEDGPPNGVVVSTSPYVPRKA